MTNCISTALLSNYNCKEETSSDINDLVTLIDWEDVCAIYKIFSDLLLLNLLIDVEAQVFTLAEQFTTSSKNQSIRAACNHLDEVRAISWLVQFRPLSFFILLLPAVVGVGHWLADGVERLIFAHKHRVVVAADHLRYLRI